MLSSFLFNAAPDMGWFAYANLTSKQYSPGLNVDFWVIGLQILGIASLAAAVSFFMQAIVNLRAPGMKMMRMPMFVWMSLNLESSCCCFPIITVALVFLMLDRNFGTHFFVPSGGGDRSSGSTSSGSSATPKCTS